MIKNLEFLLFYFKIIYNNLMNNELIEKKCIMLFSCKYFIEEKKN